jgi:hypothetical protein
MDGLCGEGSIKESHMPEETPAQKIKRVKEWLYHTQEMNRLDILNYKAGCRQAKILGKRLSELRQEQKTWKRTKNTKPTDESKLNPSEVSTPSEP